MKAADDVPPAPAIRPRGRSGSSKFAPSPSSTGVWEADDVLKAPAGALFRHGDEWAAVVMQDERAVLREIETGHGNGLETEVIRGLEEGEEVILHPSDQIVDGGRVVNR